MRKIISAIIFGISVYAYNVNANGFNDEGMINSTSSSANEEENYKEIQAKERPKCNFGSYNSSLYNYGTVIRGGAVLTVDNGYKINNLPLKKGDLIAYIPLSKNLKYYTTQNDIVLKDPSPLNPNVYYKKGKKIYVLGGFIDKYGNRFDFVDAAYYSFAVVDQDGFFCSGTFDKKDLVKSGMRTAYQDVPMSINYEPSEEVTKYAVSLSVADIVGTRLDIEIVYFINNQTAFKKIVSVNMMDKSLNINGLIIDIDGDVNTFFVKTVSMPSDFSPFIQLSFPMNPYHKN